MAVISRLLLDAIPDTAGEVVLGFQNKLDVEVLKKIRFTLPALFVQEWLVSRLTSIATMILAYSGKKEDFLSCDGIISAIEKERKAQRVHMRNLAERLNKLARFMPSPDCVELDPKNRAELERQGFNVVGDDFMTFEPSEPYDVIVMNPPFCKGQDARHILKAITMAKRKVVAIASASVLWRTDGPYKELHDAVERYGGYMRELPEKSFRDSGTMVNTALVVVDK